MLPHSLDVSSSVSVSENLVLTRQRFLRALEKLQHSTTCQGPAKTDKMIDVIHKRMSTESLSNQTIHKLSEICTPIAANVKARTLVEALLLAPFELFTDSPGSQVLSEGFLSAVCAAIYQEGVEFGFSSKCQLWCIHLPSFVTEVDLFLKKLVSISTAPLSSKENICHHDLIRACQHHSHLRMYFCDSLKSQDTATLEQWSALNVPLDLPHLE